ncbi:MAG: hypothetical protein ACFHX7_06960 [Pseudomonadota bacterium]
MMRLVLPGVVLLFCATLASGPLQAAEPAATMTYPEGRLFTTQSQRQTLDRLRQRESAAILKDPGLAEAAGTGENIDGEPLISSLLSALADDADTLLPVEITYSGYVHRSGQLPTVWIDGDSRLTGKAAPGFEFFLGTTNGREARFRVVESGVSLKPGQTFLPQQGLVLEPFEPREHQAEPVTPGLVPASDP